jgi:NitT/TauT family transport system ATP-binding protein
MTQLSVPGVCCEGVGVRYEGDRWVLRDLDWQVPAGRIVSLVGRSGCGKSTLLRAIAGLQTLSSGGISFERQGARSTTPGSVGFVFQEPALLPWRNALDNVALPLQVSGGGNAAARQRAAELLRQVGLGEADHRKLPGELSGGMRMRTSLARALITDPQLLLLDEPFAALDELLRMQLNRLLLDLSAVVPRTMVFVTHNISEAIYLGDRVAIMDQGRVVQELTIELPDRRQSDVRQTPEFGRLFADLASRLAERRSIDRAGDPRMAAATGNMDSGWEGDRC